jgi:hypothetical protein
MVRGEKTRLVLQICDRLLKVLWRCSSRVIVIARLDRAIQLPTAPEFSVGDYWMPAFAGMTVSLRMARQIF